MDIPETHRTMLYKLLKDVTDILDSNSIPYFIDGGTMLGAMREKALIPWDDDIDLGMIPPNYNKMLKIQDQFTKAGYSIQNDGIIFKVFIPLLWVHYNNKIIGTPTLDIFKYSLHGRHYVLADLQLRKRWPWAKHQTRDLFPLRKVSFGELQVSCVNNPLPYLDGTYPGWKTQNKVDLRDIDNPLIKWATPP